MSNEVAKIEMRPLAEVRTQVNAIQQVLTQVMKKGTHYDTIQGCGDKPVLLKSGAEKILASFSLAPKIKVEDLSTDLNKHYRVIVSIIHQSTGTYLGDGVGECSSLENKYAWRAALCDEEFEDTPENMRRVHYKKKYRSQEVEKIKQVRQDIYTISNTILKMAKKRALVDACMNVTACSDIFEQDLDEDHLRETVQEQNQNQQQTYQQPQGQPNAPKSTGTISEGQVKLFFAKIKEYGLAESYVDDVCAHYKIESIKDLPWQNFQALLDAMEKAKK